MSGEFSRRRARRDGWRQCNVEIPEETARALDAHLALTRVPKGDFVLLAIRNEVARQRAEGLGLVGGAVPAEGRAL